MGSPEWAAMRSGNAAKHMIVMPIAVAGILPAGGHDPIT